MRTLINMKGWRFGNAVVLRHLRTQRNGSRWLCRCDCGREFEAGGSNLRAGDINSCGCLRSVAQMKHGHNVRRTLTYNSWANMIQRCNNSNHPRYKDYGGRGITVCERWLRFENFLEDMGEAPPDHTIERKNNDRGYFKKNCKWATRAEQNKNKRPWGSNHVRFSQA